MRSHGGRIGTSPMETMCRLVAILALLGRPATEALGQDDEMFDNVTPEAFKIPALEVDTDQGWGAVGDYNNDGYPDLTFLEIPVALHLFQSEGGARFTSRHFNAQTHTTQHELLQARGTQDLSYRYLNLDLSGDGWHEVHVPVDSLDGVDRRLPLAMVRFNGRVEGTFYIDDLRLTTNPPGAPSTVVLEERTSTTPGSFALERNYPNPFNAGTVIGFALPQDGDVELAVETLTRKLTLVR